MDSRMRDAGLSGRLSQLHAVLDERLGFRQLSDLVRMAGAPQHTRFAFGLKNVGI
jgi:hypothetical protein